MQILADLADWFRQNSILITLLLTFLTAAIRIIAGPWLAEKSRQKYERRKEHRNQLRDFVLNPINQRLEEYHLPALRHDRAIVGIIHTLVPKENVRLGEVADTPAQFLAVIRPEDQQYAPTEADYYSGGITLSGTPVQQAHQSAGASAEFGKPEFLWQDAKKQFPKFFKSWDEFSTAFGDYGQTCLRQITQMSGQILEATQLPNFTPTFPKPPYANADWLARYAFLRAVGFPTARNIEVRVEEKGATWALVSQHSTTVAEGTKVEMEKCLRAAEALVEAAPWKDEIELTRARLLDETNRLLQEVQRLLLSVD
jgi:hypothetical protein